MKQFVTNVNGVSKLSRLEEDRESEHQRESTEKRWPVKDCKDKVFVEGGKGGVSAENKVDGDGKKQDVKGNKEVFNISKRGDF